MEKVAVLPVREKIGRAKSVPEEAYREAYAAIDGEIDTELAALTEGDR